MIHLPTITLRLVALVALVVELGVASPASAAASVEVTLSVAVVHSSGRDETLGPASFARPGELLEYTARYANRGTTAADALLPTIPIPEGTEYVAGGKPPRPTHASLDGSTWAPIPLHRRIPDQDGVARDIEVPTSEYRALRWTVGSLAAGREVSLQVRARLAQQQPLSSR